VVQNISYIDVFCQENDLSEDQLSSVRYYRHEEKKGLGHSGKWIIQLGPTQWQHISYFYIKQEIWKGLNTEIDSLHQRLCLFCLLKSILRATLLMTLALNSY